MSGRFPTGLKISTVQATKTSDGQLFDHPQDAIEHQIELDLSAWLDKATNGGPDKKAVTEFVMANRDKIRDILNGTDERDSRV